MLKNNYNLEQLSRVLLPSWKTLEKNVMRINEILVCHGSKNIDTTWVNAPSFSVMYQFPVSKDVEVK